MKCKVKNCPNYSGKKGILPDIRFHLFPKDETRSRQWRLAAACGPLSTLGKHFVCSIHFDQDAICLEDQLLKTPPSKCKLSDSAVPTLHLPSARTALADRTNRISKRERKALVSEVLQNYDEENHTEMLEQEKHKFCSSATQTM